MEEKLQNANLTLPVYCSKDSSPSITVHANSIIKINIHSSKMDISNIMCLLALLLCCTYLSLIQNQIGAAVLFKILTFQARRHNWIYCLNNTLVD